jgi:small-conductance mechanosensitive channel
MPLRYGLLLLLGGFFLNVHIVLTATPACAGSGPGEPSPPEAYFVVESLNENGPEDAASLNLRTPQEALKVFFSSSREANFSRASGTLNLQSVPVKDRPWYAPYLAERFYYVLNKQPWINWSVVSDREDGQLITDEPSSSGDALKPRRSIKIATVPLDQWNVEIRLERFKPAAGPAVWLFSPQTVEKIIPLYQAYGPGPLVQYLPQTMRMHLFNGDPLWQGVVLLSVALLATGLGLLIQRGFSRAIKRFGSNFTKVIVSRTQGPTALLFSAFTFYYFTYTLLSLSGRVFGFFEPFVSIMLVAAVTWLGIRVIELLAEVYTNIYKDTIALEEEHEARKLLTHISVARRLVMVCAVGTATAVAIYQARLLESWSTSFLASAGIASVILGIAAQNILGNFLAGVQIAITQPARIGDSVSFEGNWGYIEDIGFTYVTIRTWDARRLVVPVAYFISHPFENWSMREANILSVIHLYADHGINVEQVRAKFAELLKACPLWDGRAGPVLQVTGVRPDCIELRALCSAKDGPTAWDLTCLLREQLVAFVQGLDDGRFLPRHRLVTSDGASPASGHGNGRSFDQPIHPAPAPNVVP